MNQQLIGVSLFTCAGIGDLGFRSSGIEFTTMNELESDRAALAALNFPESKMFCGDINNESKAIVDYTLKTINQRAEEVFLLSCTAPCQGMSSAGMGSILNNVRAGKRPALDPRNRLIIPALGVILELNPRWVVFENVAAMKNTIIESGDGNCIRIIDLISATLAPTYQGKAYVVEFADYGVPQRRERLITVFTRDPRGIEFLRRGGSLIPFKSHSRDHQTECLKPWVTVLEAISDFPPIDGISNDKNKNTRVPFHRVPLIDPVKYEWIRNTPAGETAFNNQCINPDCGFKGNTRHGASRDENGINRANKDTLLYCARCGHLLPRPYTVESTGKKRIMKGYTSAYKRMPPNLPAPTISRNLSFPCSDQKIHPTQNRVLSLAEAMRLQTIDQYPYKWGPLKLKNKDKERIVTDSLVRIAIAESIPPLFTEKLGRHLIGITNGKVENPAQSGSQMLFSKLQ